MLDFARKNFEILIEIILILLLIVGPVGGFYVGGDFFGGLIGFIIGGVIAIAMGGYIGTILNIDKNLEKIASRSSKVLDIDENLERIINHYIKESNEDKKDEDNVHV